MIKVTDASATENGLSEIPAGVRTCHIVGDPITGEFYRGPEISESNKVFTKNDDFIIPLKQHEVLEFICLKKNTDMNIKIGLSDGGSELFEDVVVDGQPIVLQFFAESDTDVYVSGVLSGTVVKVKIC